MFTGFLFHLWDDDVIDLKLLLEDGIELEIDLFILILLIEFLSKSMCHVQKVLYSEWCCCLCCLVAWLFWLYSSLEERRGRLVWLVIGACRSLKTPNYYCFEKPTIIKSTCKKHGLIVQVTSFRQEWGMPRRCWRTPCWIGPSAVGLGCRLLGFHLVGFHLVDYRLGCLVGCCYHHHSRSWIHLVGWHRSGIRDLWSRWPICWTLVPGLRISWIFLGGFFGSWWPCLSRCCHRR